MSRISHATVKPAFPLCHSPARRLPDLTLCACYSKPWTAQNRWRFTVSVPAV